MRIWKHSLRRICMEEIYIFQTDALLANLALRFYISCEMPFSLLLIRQKACFEEEVIIIPSNSQTMAALKYQSLSVHLHCIMLLNVLPQLHSDTRNHWPMSYSSESNCSQVFPAASGICTYYSAHLHTFRDGFKCDLLDIVKYLPDCHFWHMY